LRKLGQHFSKTGNLSSETKVNCHM